ncbi:MAG: AraC family transcriptional regulator [Actinomycetota bacterium]|nr:AraC family transcriptional regulator [Actinomycetota bacterium]
MDALAGFLEGPRARRAFLLRSLMEPPWSLRIQDEAPLTVVAVVRGNAWVVPDDGDPRQLGPGDVAIIRGPDPYTIADHTATLPQVYVQPGQRCTTADGESLTEAMDLGVRTWGNDPDGSTVKLVGTYQTDGAVSRRLLDALPTLVVLPADVLNSPLVELLATEIVKDEPGQHVVLDRLLDLLLVAALRTWFARPETDPPAWFLANSDPVVGRAMRLLNNDPSHPWTVARLAAAVGSSRAALARRFHELVGEPPMTYLTNWRMALAADLLHEPRVTVGAVARQVGYASPFTFSTAFKRIHGVSPQAYRNAASAKPPFTSATAGGSVAGAVV